MFKSSKPNNAIGIDASINLISNGTEITGNIISKGDIRIDGVVKGNISSSSKVVIGATGIIIGDIDCANTDISGSLQGNIKVSDLLTLKSTAKVVGDIDTLQLMVEVGAIFTGRCNMKLDAKGVKVSNEAKDFSKKVG